MNQIAIEFSKAGYKPFLFDGTKLPDTVSWAGVRVLTSRHHVTCTHAYGQHMREEFADMMPLGYSHLVSLLNRRGCPSCFKKFLQEGGMIIFFGALHRESGTGTVCVPVVFLDDGVIVVELPPVEAYYPQKTYVAVMSSYAI